MTKHNLQSLFWLEPEVAGDLGDRTIIDNAAEMSSSKSILPLVTVLEYRFQSWLGDELLTAHPCYISTLSLAGTLAAEQLSGLKTERVIITTSPEFDELQPTARLPEFVRIVPEGSVSRIVRSTRPGNFEAEQASWSGHDLCLGPRAELLMTLRALNTIGLDRIKHCIIKPVVVWQLEQ